jgi:hypothetical protein
LADRTVTAREILVQQVLRFGNMAQTDGDLKSALSDLDSLLVDLPGSSVSSEVQDGINDLGNLLGELPSAAVSPFGGVQPPAPPISSSASSRATQGMSKQSTRLSTSSDPSAVVSFDFFSAFQNSILKEDTEEATDELALVMEENSILNNPPIPASSDIEWKVVDPNSPASKREYADTLIWGVE